MAHICREEGWRWWQSIKWKCLQVDFARNIGLKMLWSQFWMDVNSRPWFANYSPASNHKTKNLASLSSYLHWSIRFSCLKYWLLLDRATSLGPMSNFLNGVTSLWPMFLHINIMTLFSKRVNFMLWISMVLFLFVILAEEGIQDLRWLPQAQKNQRGYQTYFVELSSGDLLLVMHLDDAVDSW